MKLIELFKDDARVLVEDGSKGHLKVLALGFAAAEDAAPVEPKLTKAEIKAAAKAAKEAEDAELAKMIAEEEEAKRKAAEEGGNGGRE